MIESPPDTGLNNYEHLQSKCGTVLGNTAGAVFNHSVSKRSLGNC